MHNISDNIFTVPAPPLDQPHGIDNQRIMKETVIIQGKYGF